MWNKLYRVVRQKFYLVLPYLLLCLATFFWASNYVIGRAVHAAIDPLELAFSRWFFAALVITPIAYSSLSQQRELLLRHWKKMALLGATGIAGYSFLLYKALSITTALNASILVSLVPVLILIISRLFYYRKISRVQLLGIAISLSGALTIVLKGNLGTLAGLAFNKGDLLMLLALPFWAVYTIQLQTVPRELKPISTATSSIYAGVLLLLPFQLYQLLLGNTIPFTLETTLAIAYMGLFSSVIAIFLWTRGVLQIGATRAGIFLYTIPVFAALLSIIILHEPFYTYHGIGIILVVFGLFLTNQHKRQFN